MVACLFLTGGPLAAGQESSTYRYRIKSSEVAVPEDVPLGQYRRIIRPFENWTLICDENLRAKQAVCNVTQIIEDPSGKMVFSWSLAATKDGKPFMILRIPPSAKSDGKLSLRFPDRKTPVEVSLEGCNETVCVGLVPVGPILHEQIGKDAAPDVSYMTTAGEKITVRASLKGLATALKAIK